MFLPFLIFLIFLKLEKIIVFRSSEIIWLDSLFWFMIFSNVLGLTSFYLPLSLWPLFLIFCRFLFWCISVRRGLKEAFISFFSHFSQPNLNLFACFIIVFIEVTRVIIRILTLAFRLLANILGGHLILEIVRENRNSWLALWGYRCYEIFVCFVQAIIFSILIYYYCLESLEKI